jgi:hypothetical protein
MELSRKLSRQVSSRSLCAAVGFLFAGLAIAANTTPGRAQAMSAEEACTPDVMRLCQEAIPDRERIIACMRAKSRQLSLSCRSAMAQYSRAAKKKRRTARY